jgi:hypothetical protein
MQDITNVLNVDQPEVNDDIKTSTHRQAVLVPVSIPVSSVQPGQLGYAFRLGRSTVRTAGASPPLTLNMK